MNYHLAGVLKGWWRSQFAAALKLQRKLKIVVGTTSNEGELSIVGRAGCALERSVARRMDVATGFLVLVAIWMIWNWVYESCF